MRCMARCTRGSDNQAFLQKSFAMNTLGIVLQYMILVNDSLPGHWRAFLMASATQVRHLQRSNRRSRVTGREDFVRSVTILAPGCKGISLCDCFAVQGGPVKFLLGRVTDSAIDGINFLRVRQFCPGKIKMAGRA
jgi:hypothetical protein